MGRPAVLQQAILRVTHQRRLTANQIAGKVGTSAQSVRFALRILATKGEVHVVDEIKTEGGLESVWTRAPKLAADQWGRIKSYEEQEAAQIRRLKEWLDLWERHMRSLKFALGFPETAAGFPTDTRIKSWEDVDEELDRQIVMAIDAAIDSLPEISREAIYRAHGLTAKWPYPWTVDERVGQALRELLPLANSRCPVAS